ncbi:MAG: SGNH/GDSL hydrolase family protein [Lentisphaeria bacterium]
MQPEILPIVERLKSPEPVKWLFAGDSITHGALHTWGWRDYTELFAERIRFELGRKGDFVIKSGLSGWSTRDLLDNLEWNVLQFQADVVSIMLGVNDSKNGESGLGEFQDQYNAILDRLMQGSRSRVLLHTTNPIWPQAVERASLPLYNAKILQIARERKLPVIDHWAHWAQAIREVDFRAVSWMSDELHPNVHGHRAMAQLLFRELGIWDAAGTSCRFFVP